MNKKQLINEIMDLCDENENLKNKLKSYEAINEPVKTSIIEKTEKEIEIEKLNKKAKKLLFKECVYDWHFPSVAVKEDSGEFNFLSLEQWLKAINLSDILTSSYKYLFNNSIAISSLIGISTYFLTSSLKCNPLSPFISFS